MKGKHVFFIIMLVWFLLTLYGFWGMELKPVVIGAIWFGFMVYFFLGATLCFDDWNKEMSSNGD